MIENTFKLLLFIKDFTGRGSDRFYWFEHESLRETTAEDVASFPETIVCHDFWLIRDTLYDTAKDIPSRIVDLDEFRISISGNPDDRRSRERSDITKDLNNYGATDEICSTYKRIFNRGDTFDHEVAIQAAIAMTAMYLSLCEKARRDGEFERFFNIEVPVYHLLQKAMAAGIVIDAKALSTMRHEAEHDYFLCLKNYSAKHNMPLETPVQSAIGDRLCAAGFQLDGVSVDYVLEFVPHDNDFGQDTLTLQNLDAARKVLSSLTLATRRTRPIIDVFGSRTSRIHLRSPSLQNLPKKYRSIIGTSEGAQLSYVDFDQYEVGIMAALSHDFELENLYAAGDMYDLFASTHLGIGGNRKAAKQLFLSYAYGMSQKALVDAAVSLGASREMAKAAFKLFSQYEAWKKNVWDKLLRDERVSTPLGNHYKRTRKGPITSKEQRSAISQIVQGTASLIFKMALLEVGRMEDVTIVLPMHDALLFEHRHPGTPSSVVEVFQRTMTSVLGGGIVGKASVSTFSAV